MAEKQWTQEQAQAIKARGGTVLVSAAAGSGKTAVLVERVIGRILDEENPVDADRLLIATFSNAAALEMKQRIMARMELSAAQNPEDTRLMRQQLLLTRAQIGTIHSFCLGLIRNHFQALELSPNVRTGDEKELEILRKDCAKTVVEQFHNADESGDFARLVELLSTGRDDSRVFSTLFTLYDFVRAHPFYDEWMENKLRMYEPGVCAQDSPWGQCVLRYAKGAVSYAVQRAREALTLIAEDETMEKAYHEALSQDLSQLMELLSLIDTAEWDNICKLLSCFTHAKLRPLKGNDERKELVKALREEIKQVVQELREDCFCCTMVEFEEDISFLHPLVASLFSLVQAFDRLFSETKRQRNMMDFSDMEQFAIRLLVKSAGAGYCKTPLAESVSALYDEILVDECQDTNAAQEIIFRAVSKHEDNLFMVGDVKQSIYRFRQACPELFMQKKKEYAPYDGEQFPAKIILGKNFRSAPEITGAVNFFFSLLMSEEMGEIHYNKEEQLIASATFPEEIAPSCELALLDLTEYTGERGRAAAEAEYVAERITAMLESGQPVAENGQVRRIRPGDICILMRSPSGKAQLYLDALNARGVPVWAEPKSGFLSSREVAPVVALLRVIQNPLRGIDLASAMLSPLFGFTAEEVARIRLLARREPLWTAVLQAAQQGDAHAAELVERIGKLRRHAACASADSVLREIYELTDYLGKVQVMRMGSARRANLLLLVQYACDYHASGYKGLGGFVGFLDRLADRGGDLAPAANLSEQADVVRIMSIHRSKGLEFPVVFLCDCAKPFNKEDLRGNTLLHSELGFACMRRDFAQLKQFPTLPLLALRLEIERATLSEELRVLYVALTRAKERLILTGISMNGTQTKAPSEKAAGLIQKLGESGPNPYLVRRASSYMDWMLMAVICHPDAQTLLDEWGLETGFTVHSDVSLNFTTAKIQGDLMENLSGEAGELPLPDEVTLKELEECLRFSYPYQAQTKIPTKIAVSQLAKGDMAKTYRFARRPAFLSEGGLTGVQRGNALHKFMQFSDYTAAAQNTMAEIERMVQQGFLTRQEADAIDARRLNIFFSGHLAQRIFASPKVWRELRFLAEAGQETLSDYSDLFDGEGKTVIQGVADCIFLEDGQAVIVDYKSDHVKRPEELIERYYGQLDLYRRVLGEALGVPIKECVIYSFALSKEIAVVSEK